MTETELLNEVKKQAERIEQLEQVLSDITCLAEQVLEQHDTSTHEYDEECPWEMQELFTDTDRKIIQAARKMLE